MKLMKGILWCAFILYLACLSKIILIKHLPISIILQNLDVRLNLNQSNFVPFATITDYFALGYTWISIENIIGNIIIFVPLGLFLPILIGKFRKDIIALLLVSFIISFIFELVQLLFPIFGSFDVDDLLLNILGALIGYFAFRLSRKLYRNEYFN